MSEDAKLGNQTTSGADGLAWEIIDFLEQGGLVFAQVTAVPL